MRDPMGLEDTTDLCVSTETQPECYNTLMWAEELFVALGSALQWFSLPLLKQ